jgi:FeS assembly protein IscX
MIFQSVGLITRILLWGFMPEFGESQIYRIRFTQLLDWVMELPHFEGKREECNESHLEQIQAKWVYEWRDNQ